MRIGDGPSVAFEQLAVASRVGLADVRRELETPTGESRHLEILEIGGTLGDTDESALPGELLPCPLRDRAEGGGRARIRRRLPHRQVGDRFEGAPLENETGNRAVEGMDSRPDRQQDVVLAKTVVPLRCRHLQVTRIEIQEGPALEQRQQRLPHRAAEVEQQVGALNDLHEVFPASAEYLAAFEGLEFQVPFEE